MIPKINFSDDEKCCHGNDCELLDENNFLYGR